MLADFFHFLEAIWSEWKLLLTGGTIIACFSLWTFATGHALSRYLSWSVLVFTLVLAAFFAWRKEWVAGSRGFIDVTPAQLGVLSNNRTSVQADALISPYLGKSMKITAPLNDITTEGVLFTTVFLREPGFASMFIVFRLPYWKRKTFLTLSPGMRLTVAGRLRAVSTSTIWLKSVMLLKVDLQQQHHESK
jgi:hypothetical protein